MRAAFLSTILLVTAACGDGFVGEMSAGRANQPRLIGSWVLEGTNGSDPSSLNIKEWQITFHEGGRWTYGGETTPSSGGLRVSGDGTWKIQASNQLEYTAGGARGTSQITMQSGKLILSPDPVITLPGGNGVVRASYRRAAG